MLRRILSFATKPYRAMEFIMSGACRFALRPFGSGMSEVYTDHNLIFFTAL